MHDVHSITWHCVSVTNTVYHTAPVYTDTDWLKIKPPAESFNVIIMGHISYIKLVLNSLFTSSSCLSKLLGHSSSLCTLHMWMEVSSKKQWPSNHHVLDSTHLITLSKELHKSLPWVSAKAQNHQSADDILQSICHRNHSASRCSASSTDRKHELKQVMDTLNTSCDKL